MTPETDRIINNLERMNPLRQAPLRAAIAALHFPPGSRGLDIGCGTGDLTLVLADATRPDGQVTGLDISWPLLDYAQRKASQAGCAERIAFEQSDMKGLPFRRGQLRLGLERGLRGLSQRRALAHPDGYPPRRPPWRRDCPIGMELPATASGVRDAGGTPERYLLGLCSIPREPTCARTFSTCPALVSPSRAYQGHLQHFRRAGAGARSSGDARRDGAAV